MVWDSLGGWVFLQIRKWARLEIASSGAAETSVFVIFGSVTDRLTI